MRVYVMALSLGAPLIGVIAESSVPYQFSFGAFHELAGKRAIPGVPDLATRLSQSDAALPNAEALFVYLHTLGKS